MGWPLTGRNSFFQFSSPGKVNNRGFDSLGDISLTEVVDWEADVGPSRVRINVEFSDISRLSSVWLSTNSTGTRRYWSMQAVDRETSPSYTVSIPVAFFDAEAPLEIIARRKDGRIRPVTVSLVDGEGDSRGEDCALSPVWELARPARSMWDISSMK